MADWAEIDLSTLKVELLALIEERLNSLASLNFDSYTSYFDGSVRWSTDNFRFEVWSQEDASWSALAATYNINASGFGGQSPSFYRNASNLNAGVVDVARLPFASLSSPGILQLSESLTGNSTTRAVAESAVSALMEIIQTKANVSHGHDSSDLPSASTTGAGVVVLNSSIDSTSSSQAATPLAVKTVRDQIAGKADSDHTHSASDLPKASESALGVVQLSSSTSSNSTSLAATPSAVRTTYQLASSKANSDHSHGASDLPTASTSAKGVAQLSSSTTSSSTSLAATPAAVKAVADSLSGKANLSHSHVAADLPNASTNSFGVVQLDNSVTSESLTKAPTANVVRYVYELADGKADESHSHGSGDLPSASTAAKGLVQLSSSVSSSSTSLAATASAVRSAYNLAAGKANSSHAHSAGDLPSASTSASGLVQLSTSTSSTSTTLAATSSAVRAAYDRASEKASLTQMAGWSGTISGYRLMSNYIRMNDGVAFRLGSGNDFTMWDSGSITYFHCGRTAGQVYFRGTDSGGSTRVCIFYDGSKVRLYYGGSTRLETTSSGVNITGRLTTDFVTIENSDERIKTNIREIKADEAIEVLDRINWVLFDWKTSDLVKDDLGVIAQRLKEIYPSAVYEKDDGVLGVAYDKLYRLQMCASQAQRQQIADLQERVSSLESKI